jgi:holo-[acyl-carrier protein] synthase
MIRGHGIDLIEIDRVKAAVKQYGDKFLSRIYTPKEIEYCQRRKTYRFPELAARFAAKEAYAKANGTGMRGIHWKQIEVVNDKKGKPLIAISGEIRENVHVSLSHTDNFAMAAVIIEER